MPIFFYLINFEQAKIRGSEDGCYTRLIFSLYKSRKMFLIYTTNLDCK
ncbi:hypothetical protein EVA_09789 [gut metagenome]|uniref:Uncharacterized protein n=1 Tax=gut metagenome TaxID=749906 RepID=J9G5H5_9ZZZZ